MGGLAPPNQNLLGVAVFFIGFRPKLRFWAGLGVFGPLLLNVVIFFFFSLVIGGASRVLICFLAPRPPLTPWFILKIYSYVNLELRTVSFFVVYL